MLFKCVLFSSVCPSLIGGCVCLLGEEIKQYPVMCNKQNKKKGYIEENMKWAMLG